MRRSWLFSAAVPERPQKEVSEIGVPEPEKSDNEPEKPENRLQVQVAMQGASSWT